MPYYIRLLTFVVFRMFFFSSSFIIFFRFFWWCLLMSVACKSNCATCVARKRQWLDMWQHAITVRQKWFCYGVLRNWHTIVNLEDTAGRCPPTVPPLYILPPPSGRKGHGSTHTMTVSLAEEATLLSSSLHVLTCAIAMTSCTWHGRTLHASIRYVVCGLHFGWAVNVGRKPKE